MRAVALFLSAALSVQAIAPAAFAQKPNKEAVEHEKKGHAAFAKKDWAIAKTEWSAAYELAPSPTAAYFAGRASEELGQAAEAAGWYEKALSGGKFADEKDARARLDALRKKPVAVTIETVPEGATVRIDGTASSQKSPFFMRLAPGPHKIVAEFEGKSVSKDVEVVPFTPVTVKLEVEPSSAPPAPKPAEPAPAPATSEAPSSAPTAPPTAAVEPPPVHTTTSSNTAAFVTGGIAIVALGFGTIYGIKALDDKNKYDDHPTPERADLGKRDRLVADVSLALGIGLAVTSIVLFVTNKKQAVAIAPAVAPSFAGIGLGTRF